MAEVAPALINDDPTRSPEGAGVRHVVLNRDDGEATRGVTLHVADSAADRTPPAAPVPREANGNRRPPLLRFAYIPGFNDERLAELAGMAEQEDWDGGASGVGRQHPVLRSYLLNTFNRAEEQGRISISPDEAFACFDTGLVTPLHESLYMFFSRNDREGEGAQPWRFRGFRRRGEIDLTRFPALPERPTYFDDATEVVLSAKRDIRVNVSHIIGEHRERLPESTRAMNDYQMTAFLEGVVTMARERVAHNYKTAVPQYYNGRLQWLLPLCFEQPDKADLALTIEAYGGFYRAATCLTLEMAYNNARLIARPDQAWLHP